MGLGELRGQVQEATLSLNELISLQFGLLHLIISSKSSAFISKSSAHQNVHCKFLTLVIRRLVRHCAFDNIHGLKQRVPRPAGGGTLSRQSRLHRSLRPGAWDVPAAGGRPTGSCPQNLCCHRGTHWTPAPPQDMHRQQALMGVSGGAAALPSGSAGAAAAY